ncbi:MAG: hypothetical protein M3R08_04645 [Bacteroidota bacterium]|nr:hypothetical protein [Bacteroidota bacterium]
MNTLLMSLPLIALLAVGCSDSEHEGAVGTDRMEEGTIRPEGDGSEGVENDQNPTNRAEGNNENAGSSVDREMTAKIEVARRERKANSDELNGLRSRLIGELDEVRASLNDGSITPEKRAEDQARAATLAQGLERLDRALEAINASSEATWEEIKANSDQEVKELRVWMDDNEVRADS